jgi:hypothetical protein
VSDERLPGLLRVRAINHRLGIITFDVVNPNFATSQRYIREYLDETQGRVPGMPTKVKRFKVGQEICFPSLAALMEAIS